MGEILRFVDPKGVLVVAEAREAGGIDILCVGASVGGGVQSAEMHLSREALVRLYEAVVGEGTVAASSEGGAVVGTPTPLGDLSIGDDVYLIEPTGRARDEEDVVDVNCRYGESSVRLHKSGWITGADTANGWKILKAVKA